MYCFYRKKVVTMIMEETTILSDDDFINDDEDNDDYGDGGRRSRHKKRGKSPPRRAVLPGERKSARKRASNISVCIFSIFNYLWLACNCLGVQIQATKSVLVKLVSLLLCWSMNDDTMIMHAIIRGDHRRAAASLWLRHAPSCSLAIGPRQ